MVLCLAVNIFLMQSKGPDSNYFYQNPKSHCLSSLASLALKMSHKWLICLAVLSSNLHLTSPILLTLTPMMGNKTTMTKRILNLTMAQDDHFHF